VNSPRKLEKKELLSSKKSIQSIFDNGRIIKAYPLFISFEVVNSEHSEIKVLFSVSKKRQKLAVRRNGIKRKLKESYRLNKLPLLEFTLKEGLSLNLMIIQVTGDAVPYSTIEKKMIKGLSKLKESLIKSN
jgi:ribonuclease P protein component|tara:strand:- start:1480 stop:1872 length:393 start_codon:yes stop_codon:yes gene_type:complete